MSYCKGCGAVLPPSRGPRPRKWCSERCRKDSYPKQLCTVCGEPSSSGAANGYAEDPRCARHAKNRKWSRENIIAAFHDYALRYGRPTATAWNPNHAAANGHRELAERYYRDGCWPAVSVVQMHFGSWNNLVAAAGFDPVDTNQRARTDPEAISRTVEAYENGVPCAEIAKQEGITKAGVYMRLRGRAAPRSRHQTDDEERGHAVGMVKAGYSAALIASIYGVCPETVRNWCREFGVSTSELRRRAAA